MRNSIFCLDCVFRVCYQDKIRKIEEEQKAKLEKLHREIEDLEKERQKEMSKDKSRSRESPTLKLNLGGEGAHLRSSEERQAGEVWLIHVVFVVLPWIKHIHSTCEWNWFLSLQGMENTELEQANVLSQVGTSLVVILLLNKIFLIYSDTLKSNNHIYLSLDIFFLFCILFCFPSFWVV